MRIASKNSFSPALCSPCTEKCAIGLLLSISTSARNDFPSIFPKIGVISHRQLSCFAVREEEIVFEIDGVTWVRAVCKIPSLYQSYLYLSDCATIVVKNWDVFKEALRGTIGISSKSAWKSWHGRLNLLRNRVVHPLRGNLSVEEVDHLLECERLINTLSARLDEGMSGSEVGQRDTRDPKT